MILKDRPWTDRLTHHSDDNSKWSLLPPHLFDVRIHCQDGTSWGVAAVLAVSSQMLHAALSDASAEEEGTVHLIIPYAVVSEVNLLMQLLLTGEVNASPENARQLKRILKLFAVNVLRPKQHLSVEHRARSRHHSGASRQSLGANEGPSGLPGANVGPSGQSCANGGPGGQSSANEGPCGESGAFSQQYGAFCDQPGAYRRLPVLSVNNLPSGHSGACCQPQNAGSDSLQNGDSKAGFFSAVSRIADESSRGKINLSSEEPEETGTDGAGGPHKTIALRSLNADWPQKKIRTELKMADWTHSKIDTGSMNADWSKKVIDTESFIADWTHKKICTGTGTMKADWPKKEVDTIPVMATLNHNTGDSRSLRADWPPSVKIEPFEESAVIDHHKEEMNGRWLAAVKKESRYISEEEDVAADESAEEGQSDPDWSSHQVRIPKSSNVKSKITAGLPSKRGRKKKSQAERQIPVKTTTGSLDSEDAKKVSMNCPGCGENYHHVEDFIQHLKSRLCEVICPFRGCSHQPSLSSGDNSAYWAKTLSTLASHIKAKHTRQTEHACQICGKGFVTPEAYGYHVIQHENKEKFWCQDCQKFFPCRSEREHKARCHRGQKHYRCAVCSKLFSAAVNLQTHMLIHSNEFAYKCAECPKQFHQKNNLLVHCMRKHGSAKSEATKKSLVCAECHKRFSSVASLKVHRKRHTS